MIADETLIAYLDGELDGAARADLETNLKSDKALEERLARLRGADDQVRAAFAGVMTEAVPDRLLRSVDGEASGKILPLRRQGAAASRALWWSGAAMAASLALGIFVGRSFTGTEGLIGADFGARGALAAALDRQLSSDGGRDLKVAFSFRATDGSFCRVFDMTTHKASGLACGSGGRWRVVMLTPNAGAAQSTYRMAGSALPPALAAAAQNLADGAALTRTEETQARKDGWTPSGRVIAAP